MKKNSFYIVVFGVSGCGKTLISKMLAEKLKIEFLEGDDYHPNTNVEKMKSGHPLNDEDRIPWLLILKEQIHTRVKSNTSFILSCSALKTSYRNTLREAGNICFIFLDVPESVVLERLISRRNHFMPATLLHSQIETLEQPIESEQDVLTINATQTPTQIVADILTEIG